MDAPPYRRAQVVELKVVDALGGGGKGGRRVSSKGKGRGRSVAGRGAIRTRVAVDGEEGQGEPGWEAEDDQEVEDEGAEGAEDDQEHKVDGD